MSGFTPDRSLLVPPGRKVATGYVAVERVRMACRDRMAVGDVEQACRKLLQLGSASSWPPPNGRWTGEMFELLDGRHEFIAALMLGRTHLFVAWIEEQPMTERPTAETGDAVSAIAARYARLTPDTLLGLTATPQMRETSAAEIRSMAASLLRQDQTRGLRGIFRKVTGR